MPKNPVIEVTLDGPYIVRDLNSLKNSRGESMKTQQVMALCRCGKSSTKPFCNGTHRKIGFSGRRERERIPDTVDNYHGKEITIHDNRCVCARAGHCTSNAPSVFRSDRTPWIDPNGASADHIADAIRRCPSGALSYSRDGVLFKNQDRTPSITVSRNASYAVVGAPDLLDPLGSKPESKEHYTLCRCGGSKNKPFCDGTHIEINFTDSNS